MALPEFPFWLVTYRTHDGEIAVRVRAETAELAQTRFERDYPGHTVIGIAKEVFRHYEYCDEP